MMPEIRIVNTTAELEQVYQFRYKIYVDEMGRKQTYADHRRKTIIEPLDKTGYIFGAFENGEVVGTFRVNLAKESDLGYYVELYRMPSVGESYPNHTSIITKLIVDQNHRFGKLTTRLCQAAYIFGMEHEIKFNFIDCNEPLVGFFMAFGYEVYTANVIHPEYGEVTPMVCDLMNIDLFRRRKSPLAESYESFFNQRNSQEKKLNPNLITA